MEKFKKDKKPLLDGKLRDLLKRLTILRKRTRQTNEKLNELKKQADDLLHHHAETGDVSSRNNL